MRVLHVISSLARESGGPSTALVGLVRAQEQVGLTVSVASTWTAAMPETLAPELEASGATVHLAGPARGPLCRHPSIKPLLRKLAEEADVVHIHGLWEEIQHQACMASRQCHRPYIIRPCGMLDPWSLSQSKWRKRAYMAWRLRRNLNRASAIHFTAELERALTEGLHLRAPAIVVPNGIDLSQFEELPARGSFRKQYPGMGDTPMVLFLSRLHPKKGLDVLIPSFAQVVGTFRQEGRPVPTLVIAGPDSDGYEAVVRTMINDQGISEHVIITGPLYGKTKIAAYHDADLFVLPSYQENFGNVVIEALATGCPVLISDQVNIYREIIRAEVGSACPPNPAAFAEGIARYLTGPFARNRESSDRACRFARVHYDWSSIAREWQRHYDAVFSGAAL